MGRREGAYLGQLAYDNDELQRWLDKPSCNRNRVHPRQDDLDELNSPVHSERTMRAVSGCFFFRANWVLRATNQGLEVMAR
jgi:hypothetical protein